MSPRFSISVLAYNNFALTKRCIESVLDHSADFELLLTDNACGDGTAEYFDALACTFGNVRVFHNPTNEGFIDPNLRALNEAKGQFLVFLNNDATVPAGWLDALVKPFDDDPMVAITGPEGGCCRLDARVQGVPGKEPEYVEFACAMARVDLLREHGLFDPAMAFAYFEDVHTSLRMRELGYKLKLVPFHIVHQRAATSGKMPEIRKFQALNGQFIRRRWEPYLRTRRFDYVTVIRRDAAWGDVLLTTPIIRAIKKRNPQSPIWVDTKCAEIFRSNHDVTQSGKFVMPRDAHVIDLNGASENRPLTHLVAAYAEVAGIDDYNCAPSLPFSDKDEIASYDLLHDDIVGCVAVHVGPTTWNGKNWPMERWAELISRMACPVVLVGHHTSQRFDVTVDLRGKTNVHTLAAVLKRCSSLITLDSFPLHVAQAVGTPVVGLFGITSPQFILTDGSRHRAVCSDPKIKSTGLRHRTRGQTMVHDEYGCMNSITVDDVYRAYSELVAEDILV